MDIKFILYFVIPVVLIVIITGVGLIFLRISATRKKKVGHIEIDNWATTGGKILSVSLDPHTSDGPPAGKDFEPHIEYAYTVNNVEYLGKKVLPGKSEGFTEPDAREILSTHPVNSYVQVHFNPLDPSDSALLPHSRRTDFITMAAYSMIGFGIISCCFTSFMAFIILGAIK
jgi:Protein of unknown function (DUF3592)